MSLTGVRCWRWILLLLCLNALPLFASESDQPLGLVGKDEWLYFRFEYLDASSDVPTAASVDLIRRFNKVLAQNGVSMTLAMVPLKARIYAEHLPDSAPITPYMSGNYERLLKALRAAKVSVVDLNQPFLNSPKRNSDTPLFFRLDTHWSPAGAMLAAEAVRAQIDADAVLRSALNAVPAEKYLMNWGKRKPCSAELRGLVEHLPKGSPAFGGEQLVPLVVNAESRANASLLGEGSQLGITLLGSSYSAQCYQFPDALRYTLQRNLLDISVVAQHGAWEGIETYLRDQAFQTKPPKLLIWEIPERDMRAPPDFKYREVRYQSDNTEWLLRASALVQRQCAPSAVTAKIVAGGLASAATGQISVGKTTDKDFIEISFSKPLDKLDYLSASVTASGAKKLVFEASGAGGEPRWFDVVIAGDGNAHQVKTPLPSRGKGFTKVKIYPGKNNSFIFNGLQVCRQPEDLLR